MKKKSLTYAIVEISSIEKDVGNVRDVINVVFSTGYIIYMHTYTAIYIHIIGWSEITFLRNCLF